MPRLARHAFTALSALSLLLCIAVCVLTFRSRRDVQSLTSWTGRSGDRHSIRVAGGRFTLCGPPSEKTGAPRRGRWGRTAGELVAAIRNEDLRWEVERNRFDHNAPPRPESFFGSPHPDVGSAREGRVATRELELELRAHRQGSVVGAGRVAISPADVTPPLLRALEDPGRFVAAHYLLVYADDVPPAVVFDEKSFEQTFAGLRVQLQETEGGRYSVNDANVSRCVPTIDTSQFAAIREQWHRKLDVVVASISWQGLAAATLLLPVTLGCVTAARSLRGASRRRCGLCASCGYDLRASPGRCPECGLRQAQSSGPV